MGRLIDADKLYEDLANNLGVIMGDGSDGKVIDTYSVIGDIIHDTVAKQPTAYDVDAVVKQLDRSSDYYEFEEQGREHVQMVDFEEAIEIVKGGGVDGN